MDKVLLAHGGGGSKSAELTRLVFQRYLRDPLLMEMDDAARLPGQVFTTDSFVVKPLFFPGGDIGRLAVSGTVNDLAVMGAEPLYLSIAFIIEEGFPVAMLEKILASIARACRESGARIVCADTKVVEKGKADGLFINTAGIGRPFFKKPVLPARVRPGDAIIINGPLGLHGISVLTARGEFGLRAKIKSDVAPLWGLIKACRRLDVPFMRDPTRGGLAQTLNELAQGKRFGVRLKESELPIPKKVAAVCDLLGFDPLHVANEGKVVMVVAGRDAQKALQLLRGHPLGKGARRIGAITTENPGRVTMATRTGSERIVMPPLGEILPPHLLMHEGAIAAAIIQGALEVLEKEKIAAARTVTVLIGRLHHVVPDVLQNHYKILKKECPALSRSKLLIEIAPVRITCRACKKETLIEKPLFACASCGSTHIEITSGREMHLKEVIGAGRKAEDGRQKKKSKLNSKSQIPNPK